MASKFSNSAAALALGMAFVVAPALLGTTSPFAIDSAFAEKGGKGGGGSKSEKSSPSKTEKTEKTSQGSIASALGALNAAHAAPQAFANAAPDSRIGKIKAYYLADLAAESTDVAELQAIFDSSAPTTVLDAYEALQADPTSVTLQQAYDQAVADALLTDDQVTALEAAYSAWQDAIAADAEAAATLDAAANKTPVSDETKAALDALLVGKIN